MKIESVDFFYLSMPEVLDIGDGSQDALLVRVAAGGYEGWGECEAAPLVSIASWACPMSHNACKPVKASVLGQRVDSAVDIERIGREVRANSLDLLQADHTLSGIDIALWDLLGRKQGRRVYEMLGYPRAFAKMPYASALFGDEPQQTLDKAKHFRGKGFAAVKFGWGPFGKGTPQQDADELRAAREGLGADGTLLVDVGTVWDSDVGRARQCLSALRECRATWLEEPFVSGALEAYAALAKEAAPIKLAGGEGAHNAHMARHMIDYAGIGYVQIDTGRIGGITPAKQVADYAAGRGVTYVNHTFTSYLALSASLQPCAGLAEHVICEYPVEPKPLARELTTQPILPGPDGLIHLPDLPGLGLDIDRGTVRKYLVETEIRVGGRVIYSTPTL